MQELHLNLEALKKKIELVQEIKKINDMIKEKNIKNEKELQDLKKIIEQANKNYDEITNYFLINK